MTRRRLLVIGRGVAGLAAARRLAAAGWAVTVAGGVPARRIVTIDRSVAELLSLEYGASILRDSGPLLIETRLLRWSTGTAESTSDWLVVVELSRLHAAIASRLPGGIDYLDAVPDASGFDYVLDATGRARRPQFVSGRRTAYVWTLPDGAAGEAEAIVASGDDGWVFAAPAPRARQLVQLVLPGAPRTAPEAVDAAIRTLAGFGLPGAEDLAASPPAIFDATPCFTDPVAGPGRLRVGDAAAASDPLAGEGVGRALRSAILAAATLLRAADGDGARAFGNYTARIALAQATHLRACAAFYGAARARAAFDEAIATMTRHAGLLESLAARGRPCMRLDASGTLPALTEAP